MRLEARYELENGSLRQAFEVAQEVPDDSNIDAGKLRAMLSEVVSELAVTFDTDSLGDPDLRVIGGGGPPAPAEASTDDDDEGAEGA